MGDSHGLTRIYFSGI